MLRVGHQLFAFAAILAGGELARRYGAGAPAASWYGAMAASVPLAAAPVIAASSILPDGDGGGKIARVWFLRPVFFLLSPFLSHRGFTHRLEGIALFCFGIWALTSRQPTAAHAAGVCALFAMVSLSVFESRAARWGFALLCVPLYFALLDPAAYRATLFAAAAAYVSHPLADALSTEGWVPFALGKLRAKIRPPFAFRVGGGFESGILYPAMGAAIAWAIWARIG